jgi:predicted amidophosphoribosyltransferase
MKKVIAKCDKCNQSTADINICDNCGKDIDHASKIFFDYVTVRRTNPEGEDTWDFEFCDFKCLVEWMNKRTITKAEHQSFSPYDWQQEPRIKFNIKP